MNKHGKIKYVKFPAKNIEAAKAFFVTAFGWEFDDFGPEYISFANEGLDVGFVKSDSRSSVENGSALLVFYINEIEHT